MSGDVWLDVINFRPRGDGKPFAMKIGSAKKTDKGISVYLDALPLPDKEGRVSLLISARRDDSGSRPQPRRPEPARDDFDDTDTIPF